MTPHLGGLLAVAFLTGLFVGWVLGWALGYHYGITVGRHREARDGERAAFRAEQRAQWSQPQQQQPHVVVVPVAALPPNQAAWADARRYPALPTMEGEELR